MAEARIPRQMVEFQRQLVEFQKTAFDSTFNALSALQDQQRELMSRLLEGSPIPSELKQLMEEWERALEIGREQFRDTVDRSFETVESYLERLAGEAEPSSGSAAESGARAEKSRKPTGRE
ncbi:MAG TPA: hypothetical protein VMS86_10165 [Thermoanaerobaculia bacterium]|nr:hypothetical protein [Thermoanaerobaculia bacterium]